MIACGSYQEMFLLVFCLKSINSGSQLCSCSLCDNFSASCFVFFKEIQASWVLCICVRICFCSGASTDPWKAFWQYIAVCQGAKAFPPDHSDHLHGVNSQLPTLRTTVVGAFTKTFFVWNMFLINHSLNIFKYQILANPIVLAGNSQMRKAKLIEHFSH